MPPHSAIVTVPENVDDPDPDNNLFTDGGGLGRPADLTISKTIAPAVVVAGLPVTYTITVTNTGSADADGATVLDLFPPTISGVTWTCSGANGATCAQASGSGDLMLSLPSFPVGGTAMITISGVVAADATGNLVNTAQLLPPVGVDDPTFANNTSTLSTPISVRGDLAITRTSNPAVPQAGQPITYTLTVTNAGPSTVVGATVVNIFPVSVTNVIWNCSATFGSACLSSGNGNINAPVTLAPGGSAVFTATGVVSPAALTMPPHSAIVTVPGNVDDPDPDNNLFTDVAAWGDLPI
jgi:conserved repeat domain